MLRQFFEWVSGKPKEWLAKPRLLPEAFRDEPAGSPNWVMSQEFADPNYRNRRYYLAAMKETPSDSYWTMVMVSRDLKHGDNYYETSRRHIADDAQEVLFYLKRFEESCIEKEFIPIQGAHQTYKKFANLYSIHFDDKGESFTVDTAEPIAKDVFMNRESLEKIFHQASDKKPELDSWENLYTYIVNGSPAKGVTVADLAEDPAWPNFSAETQAMMGKLEKLGAYLNDEAIPERQKRQTLANMVDYVVVDPTKFDGSEKMKLAQHIVDATVLVGMLRAGSELYDAQFSKGLSLSPDMIKFVGKVGSACEAFGRTRFELSDEEAKPIANIISLGADPFGDALPMALTLAQYPAPVQQPAAPKPVEKPQAAAKPKNKPSV